MEYEVKVKVIKLLKSISLRNKFESITHKWQRERNAKKSNQTLFNLLCGNFMKHKNYATLPFCSHYEAEAATLHSCI